MIYVTWDKELGEWKGSCPRCGSAGFFKTRGTTTYNKVTHDSVACSGGHMFVVEYLSREGPGACFPIGAMGSVPAWLPEEYHDCYKELVEVYREGKYRSVIALCGILLESHANYLLKNPGEKGKSLYDRLEILQKTKLIDKEQFSSATITRITRKGVLHPKEILKKPLPAEAKEVFESISAYLERAFRFQRARALPPGKEKGENQTH